MPPVLFCPVPAMRCCARPNDEFTGPDEPIPCYGEPIPCYGEPIPCFAAEQGIASKALGLLREMTLRLAKSIKKGQKLAKFPVLFPVTRESARWRGWWGAN